MLIKAKVLKDYHLNCTDGDVGKVKEFYFDDRLWTIRYFVIETGTHWSRKEVLISPTSLDDVLNEDGLFVLNSTREEIENSPSPESDRPLSRQFEEAHHGYYKIPKYWSGEFSRAFAPNFFEDEKPEPKAVPVSGDPHLRSSAQVRGYSLYASDGKLGHIEDFVFDDQTWTIRYLIAATGNWLSGKKVLISPEWVNKISWADSEIHVDLTRESIQNSPEYSDEAALTRRYETGLHRNYNRRGYWEDSPLTGPEPCTRPK